MAGDRDAPLAIEDPRIPIETFLAQFARKAAKDEEAQTDWEDEVSAALSHPTAPETPPKPPAVTTFVPPSFIDGS